VTKGKDRVKKGKKEKMEKRWFETYRGTRSENMFLY